MSWLVKNILGEVQNYGESGRCKLSFTTPIYLRIMRYGFMRFAERYFINSRLLHMCNRCYLQIGKEKVQNSFHDVLFKSINIFTSYRHLIKKKILRLSLQVSNEHRVESDEIRNSVLAYLISYN